MIIASYENTVMNVLQSNRSIRMSVPEKELRFFKFSVLNETVTDITF